jgi:fructose-1,6-bisphosphatase/inositol monophosphatase family enzyme
VVVGEEMVSADASILGYLASEGDVWLLDPLDGTANFAAGTGPFAMMAALVRHGETIASWILEPLSGRLACAQRGAGSWLDGRRIMTSTVTAPTAALTGAVLRRFLPDALARHVASAEPQFAELSSGSGCAGADYPAITSGVRDFTLYWRTLPWDHAPGVLFVREAGGVAQRLDGSAYRPSQHARPGLLVARNVATWDQALDALVPSGQLIPPLLADPSPQKRKAFAAAFSLLLDAFEAISQQIEAALENIVAECLRFGQQHLHGEQAGKRDGL